MADKAEVSEPKWSGSFLIYGVRCAAAEHDGGWLVSSATKPRFCFYGKTRADAEAIAERGVLFWKSFER